MKKLFTLLAVVTVVSAASAQYQRMVLFEEFTQASCGPCASQNPAFNALLDDNLDKATSIKYQTSWPGFDPMHNHNPSQVNTRVSYYGVTGVPTAIMDGAYAANDCGAYLGAPACVNQTDIDNQYAVESPFYMELTHTVANDYGSVDVELYIATNDNVSGNFVAHIVVVERAIIFETAPGSNGEKEFYNVMKRMLPAATGTEISDSWGPGDATTILESWNFENVYDPSEIAIVAFIQDVTTKEVMQAAYSAPAPVYDVDVTTANANATSSSNPFLCDGSSTPAVTIKNIGADPLTSATLSYSFNGGAAEVYNWTGNLAYGESEVVTLPGISFTLEAENTLEVTISNPNGGADGYDGNNTTESIAYGAPEAPTNTIELKIRTDNYPEETTWAIYDESNNVIIDGGPYNGQTNTVVFDEEIALPATGCYEFRMDDTYGDGICCSWGLGYWEIKDSEGVLLVEGGEFGSTESKNFKTLEFVSVENNAVLNEITLYPNPANELVMVNFNTKSDVQLTLNVTDMLGRQVVNPVISGFGSNGQSVAIPVQGLADGYYMLTILGEGVRETVRFAVMH